MVKRVLLQDLQKKILTFETILLQALLESKKIGMFEECLLDI
jgi:hypothetical protein